MSESDQNKFLPANESAWFISVFDIYCRWLFRRRFDSVDIQTNYRPADGRKTIYFLNHNSWWDGLIPFLLNQKLFHQKARGMMDLKQLRQYPFFRRLGVFSIDLSSGRSSMQSLRYAIRSLERPDAALYIYPQGKIEPFSTNNLQFRKGIGWLAKKVPDADLVPVAIYIHTKESDKPRLEIRAGHPIRVDRSLSSEEINQILQNELSSMLEDLVHRE